MELGVDAVDVTIDEDLLPGHNDVVEHHGRVDLVEPRGERVVEDARRRRRVRAARVEPEALGVHRHDERDGVVLVTRDERGDVGEEEPVGHRRRRGDRLSPAHDDPAVGLPHDAGMEERLRMAVGGP